MIGKFRQRLQLNSNYCYYYTALTTNDGSEVRLVSNCTCIGYPLEFQCIAIGPGATIWQGGAFNCSSSLNKIQLYHSRFATRTAAGSCNNGNIIARALDSTEGRYRSQLNIHSLTPEMNGTTIECLYDNGTHIHSINNITITITTGKNLLSATTFMSCGRKLNRSYAHTLQP